MLRTFRPALVALAILFGFSLLLHYNYSYAETPGNQDIAEIKRDIKDIKKSLTEIKQFLISLKAKPKKPVRTTSSTTVDDDPVLGSSSAPITLVEFSDFQCPYCARFYRDTYPVLKKEYIDTGKLRYVYRDFPLSFHKQAQKAHQAANCAWEQGKFWEMHDNIFDNQKQMEVEDLRGYAGTLGIDMPSFNRCLDSGKYAGEIAKDIEAGGKAGVQGTPSFVMGMTQENGQVKGLFIRGAQPTAYFKQQIDALLKQIESRKQTPSSN